MTSFIVDLLTSGLSSRIFGLTSVTELSNVIWLNRDSSKTFIKTETYGDTMVGLSFRECLKLLPLWEHDSIQMYSRYGRGVRR